MKNPGCYHAAQMPVSRTVEFLGFAVVQSVGSSQEREALFPGTSNLP